MTEISGARTSQLVTAKDLQGASYCAFIERELEHEINRRAKLDARSTSLVTSSGAFVVLLVGIGAFAGPPAQRGSLRDSLLPLMAALTAFIGAAALGVLANALVWVSVADETTMREMLGHRWQDHNVDASNNVAALRIDSIVYLRRRSNIKARLLTSGLQLQFVAFLTLTWTLFAIAL